MELSSLQRGEPDTIIIQQDLPLLNVDDISSTEAHIGPYEIFWRILVAEIERC